MYIVHSDVLTDLRWLSLVLDKLTNGQDSWWLTRTWSRAPLLDGAYCNALLLARSVLQKLNRVISVQVRRYVRALTAVSRSFVPTSQALTYLTV